MASFSVAAEWQLLYNRYYRKLEICKMRWKHIDLSCNRVACATFSGPIAVILDDSQVVQLYAESVWCELRIFNSAGVLISEAAWKHAGGDLVGMSWTDDQTLICVVQDGTIYRFNVHAELLEPNISMGSECFNLNIVECKFWGNGLICLTEGNEIFCVPDFKMPQPCKLSDPALEECPLCMAVIEPQYTISGNVEVLLGVGDHVLLVEEDGFQQLGAGLGPMQKMVVSQNGKLLASFTHDGRLLVISTDFSKIVFEYNCELALPAKQLAWCGMDSVLLYWDDQLLVVGPYGDPIRYIYDEPIILSPECDGVRILSNTSMEFLERVPDSTVSIFNIGSTVPAALLYDAVDYFDRRSAKADENLKIIRSSLPEAVEGCIDAACHEFDVARQRKLLRAASYGQVFCSHSQRDRFQEICKSLRVLNAVRNPEIGVPLSIRQYELLTAPVLISRLINAHHHLPAFMISEYLGMNQVLVIMHWACLKITVSVALPDATILEILLEKLKLCKGISYAAVAAHADKSGRRKLAALLVEHEPLSKQVPFLLSICEQDTALTEATRSGDTDLVHLVLFHIWQQKKSPSEFFETIQSRSLPRDLFITYSCYYGHEFLKDFFLFSGQLQELALLLWKESWKLGKNLLRSKGSSLHGPRIELIEEAQNLFLRTKEHTFEFKAAEEHAKLLRMQHELEVQTMHASFIDSSISDTIRTCIELGNQQQAMTVRTEFKVSEKRWYWLKVIALAMIRDWDALEKFSNEKRPPIGYKAFVEVCIDADKKDEALKYIPKLADPREKAESYSRIGMVKEAADAESQAKDGELLGRLKFTFARFTAASSILDTLRPSFQVNL